jgi:hypothetical protein
LEFTGRAEFILYCAPKELKRQGLAHGLLFLSRGDTPVAFSNRRRNEGKVSCKAVSKFFLSRHSMGGKSAAATVNNENMILKDLTPACSLVARTLLSVFGAKAPNKTKGLRPMDATQTRVSVPPIK